MSRPNSASLSAEINPGLGDTIYLFEYGTSSSYGQATVPSASIGSDEVPHAVTNEITELTPGVTYHFRVVATNFGGTTHGSDQTFNTPGPPAIEATSDSGVTQTGATLEAMVRPAFSPTTYHFEYGANTSYGATTAESQSIGADNVQHAVSQAISGLIPGRPTTSALSQAMESARRAALTRRSRPRRRPCLRPSRPRP